MSQPNDLIVHTYALSKQPRGWCQARVKAAGVNEVEMVGGQIRRRFAPRRSERFTAARLASPARRPNLIEVPRRMNTPLERT